MRSLPPGWAWATLGEIAQTQLGKMLSAKARSGDGRPYLRNKNVQWGRIDVDDVLRMDFSEEEFEKLRLRDGDLLVCEGGEVGRAAIWRGALAECGYQKALHRVRPLGGVVSEYLLYLLMHYAGSRAFDRFVTGSTIAHLPQEDLRELPIPLPPLAEQKRIVGAIEEHLSRLDGATAFALRARRRLAMLRRAAYARASTEGHPCHLGELVERIEAGRSFGGAARAAGRDEWGVIRVSAMTWGEFRPDENKVAPAEAVDPRWEIRPGDLLVSRANTTEYVGAAVLVNVTRPRLLLSDKSLRLVAKPGVDRHWLLYALSAPQTREQISAGATGTSDSMRNISQDKLRAVTLRVPELLRQRELAGEIGEVIQQLESLREAIEVVSRRADMLRRSILARAFHGSLVPQDPDDEPASVLLERIAAERTALPKTVRRRATMKAS